MSVFADRGSGGLTGANCGGSVQTNSTAVMRT